MRTWVPSSVSRGRATPAQATTGNLSKPRRCPLPRSLDRTTTMRHDVEKAGGDVPSRISSQRNALHRRPRCVTEVSLRQRWGSWRYLAQSQWPRVDAHPEEFVSSSHPSRNSFAPRSFRPLIVSLDGVDAWAHSLPVESTSPRSEVASTGAGGNAGSSRQGDDGVPPMPCRRLPSSARPRSTATATSLQSPCHILHSDPRH